MSPDRRVIHLCRSVKSVRRNNCGRESHRSHRSPQILAFVMSPDRRVIHLCRSVKSVRRNHRGRVSHRSHRSPQILAFSCRPIGGLYICGNLWKSVRRNHRGRESHRSHRSPQIFAFVMSHDRRVIHLWKSVEICEKKSSWERVTQISQISTDLCVRHVAR